MRPLFSLQDDVVLVTGAGRGNGRAIADGLAALGARVFGIDLNFPTPADSFEPLTGDVGDEGRLAAVLDEIVARCGTLNGLVNNAGITLPGADGYSPEAFETSLRVNALAPLRLSLRAAEIMRRQGKGSIVNITSLGAHQGFPGNPAYQASKAALRQMTRALAVDLGRDQIRVNNVCPGYIKTEMTAASYADPAKREERSSRMLLGRWGESADLVGPCAFLLSDASRYITGTDIIVDGGWLAKGL